MQSMQHMNNMMNSFFGNPFGMMGPALMGPDAHRRGGRPDQRHNNQMMPFGFPQMPSFNINGMIGGNFDDMTFGANGHGMTSTSIMRYTSGPDGRPQIYQASQSTRAAPGGVKETKQSVYDSTTGTKKLAIGHHIGDRAHIIEKKKDLNNGDEEEHQEFINLDDDEAETFNREFESHIRSHADRPNRSDRALGQETTHHRKRSDPKRLALTDGTTSQLSSRSKWAPSARRSIRPSSTPSRNSKSSGNAEESEEQDEIKNKTSTETSTSRKRERNADNETSNKRHMSNSHD
ncbi:hypothetical protein PV325_004632 [Microctonus aethiopoides]|nr:hypothetical protein PV325_004632 [Microctonus aethiopoides]